MRLGSTLGLLIFLAAYLLAGAMSADSSETDNLLQEVEDDIRIWQISRASDSVNQALSIASSDEEIYRANYLKALVEFNKGNYESAGEYAEKTVSLKEPQDTDYINFIIAASKHVPDFKEIRSENFLIRYSNPKDIILAEYAKDVLEKSRYEIGLDLEIYPEEPVIVEIYPDMNSFTLASTLPAQNVEKTGVVGICKFNRIMILSPRLLPKGYTWADTLAHEYVHYLLFLKSENTVPVWLHEGIAKYEEKRWKEKQTDVISPFYETILSEALENDELVPIEKMHPSLAMLDSARQAQLAFAQSGTMVDYLEDNWGQDALTSLIDSLRETDDYKLAIEKVAALEFSEFYDSWENDLRSKGLEERIPDVKVKGARIKNTEKESSDGSEDLVDIENFRAKDYTRLGDLLKQRGRLNPASYEYEKALALDPYSPIISSRLASTLNAMGESNKAREILHPVLDLYPNHLDIHMILGRIYLDEGNYNMAQQEYMSAAYINPYNPEVHASLIILYDKLKEPELKSREEKFLKILLGEETDNGEQSE